MSDQPAPGAGRMQAAWLLAGSCLIAFLIWSVSGVREPASGRAVLLAALAAVAAIAYRQQAVLERYAQRGIVFERLALGAGGVMLLLGLLIAGPLAAFAVEAIPELTPGLSPGRHVTRFWHTVNLASFAAGTAAASLVLSATDTRWAALAPGAGTVLALLGAGSAYLLVNYLVMRGIGSFLAAGAPVRATIRRELLPALPSIAVMVAVATATALLTRALGVAGLAPLAIAVAAPQLVLMRITRAPRVAALPAQQAARAYRAALAAELRLTRRGRRMLEQAAALVERGPVDASDLDELTGVLGLAAHVDLYDRHLPDRRAPLPVQIILFSREWAALTAHGTRALAHREALIELAHGPLLSGAPQAFTAAKRVCDRELALTCQTAGLPVAHRLPALLSPAA